jgi:hypothetical protein
VLYGGSGRATDTGSREEHHVVGHELLTVMATVDSDTGATILTVASEADMLTAPVLRQRLDIRRIEPLSSGFDRD